MSIPEQFVIRDQRRVGYFTVDNEIIDDHGAQIGAYGVAVYCVISRHSRNQVTKLSQRDIAAGLGISQDRVRKSLADLVTFRLIYVEVPERIAPGLTTAITLLDVKPTERHTFSSASELNATRSRNKEVKTKTETKTEYPPLFEGVVSGEISPASSSAKTDDVGENSPDLERVIQAFERSPVTTGKVNASDRAIAKEMLLICGVDRAECVILLATARRMSSHIPGKVHSMSYFKEALLDPEGCGEYSASYAEYLRRVIERERSRKPSVNAVSA
jgi:hypothetical protein